MDRTFQIRGCDWLIHLRDVVGRTVGNVVIEREKKQNFHATMVDDTVDVEGRVVHFRQLMFFEHHNGHDRVGDVVIVFRMNPYTKRYMVQVEEENIFETETDVSKTFKADRSSIDNIVQAVKRSTREVGWQHTNPRRIGGKPIASHYVIAGWRPKDADKMMDVYDYVQTLDSLGHSAFLKSLQMMQPASAALTIFEQMRTPLNTVAV